MFSDIVQDEPAFSPSDNIVQALGVSKIPLNGAPFTWFVAGGWAIDLFLGRQTRNHADLDLGIFRGDQITLQEFLSGWSFSKIVNGESYNWVGGERLLLPVHEIHSTGPDGNSVEILLAEHNDSEWIYRRDQKITMPISSAIWTAVNGLQVLAPEIVLLFKSKDPRDRDQVDFENVRPHLPEDRVQWLLKAIKRTNKTHSWIPQLSA